MTCRGFSGSSDACSPEFSILGRSYVATFFYLASKCYTNLSLAGHDFLLHLLAALTTDPGLHVQAGVSRVSETI